MEEEWRQITDYPDYYISNLGNIKSFKRGKEKILKQHPNHKGYLLVGIVNENGQKKFGIHRLMAKMFLEDFCEELYVDHIDRIKTNNVVSNLRMVTNQENIRNQSKRPGCSSKYKGVNFDTNRNKWCAKLKIYYKTVNLGRFLTEEDAAKAYNQYIQDNNLEYYVLNEI